VEGGFDVAFLSNHADLSFTLYDRTAKDVIFDLPLPASSGYQVQARNAASIQNRGMEITLNVRPYQSQTTDISVAFQYARNRNKVLELQGANAVDFPAPFGYFEGTVVSAVPGYGVGVLRTNDFARCRYEQPSNVVDGIDINAACRAGSAPDGAMYIGTDGFPIQDPELRAAGDPNPRWSGSIRPSLTYRGVNFSALVDVRRGGQVWNGTKGALYNFGTHGDTELRARCVTVGAELTCTGNERIFGTNFTPGRAAGDATSFAVVGPGAGQAVPIGENWYTGLGSGFGPVATQFFEDGSFVKLREISIGYIFSQPAVQRYTSFSTIEVRLAGRNLGLWTDYTGVDPETNLSGAGVGARGIDYFNNPGTRSAVIMVGLNR
jgi:hypothetical protein